MLYTNGIETWVAKNIDDLNHQLKEFYGQTPQGETWLEVDPETSYTIEYSYDHWMYAPPILPGGVYLEKHGDGIVVSAPAAVWEAIIHRGFLCSTEI